MFRYLRIAILPLIAVAVMPTPYGMAEDIGSQRQISTNLGALPLIRVQYTEQCRRDCDATYAACIAEIGELARMGAGQADREQYALNCNRAHAACYRAC